MVICMPRVFRAFACVESLWDLLYPNQPMLMKSKSLEYGALNLDLRANKCQNA